MAATYLAGDFNRDGHVNAADILAMEQALTDLPDYESANALTNAQLALVGDINGDGIVNGADLQALLNQLKSGGGSNTSVPEPSAALLAIISLACCTIFVRTRLRLDQTFELMQSAPCNVKHYYCFSAL